MSINAIAIDDEPLALNLIREFSYRIPGLNLLQTFENALEGKIYLKSSTINLLFIDINMPDISGIDLVKGLPEKPMIIFTTAHKKFAIQGFELDAIDYLLKPFSFERFARAVQKAIEYNIYKTAKYIKNLFVYSEYRLIKIELSEIEYIESIQDYVKIHLPGGKSILTHMTLKGILDKLSMRQFKRIHRSYIVPIAKVKSVLNKKVLLTSSQELPISDSYSDFIEEWKKM